MIEDKCNSTEKTNWSKACCFRIHKNCNCSCAWCTSKVPSQKSNKTKGDN